MSTEYRIVEQGKFLTQHNEDAMPSEDIKNVLDNLVKSLQPSDPYKIVLFGSYANGKPNQHSDIDLMVILDNNHISKTYQERLDKKVSVRRLVLEINEEVPLDLLVYSKAEYKKVKNYENFLIDEIEKTGKIIYEKAN
jgi:predicted nucleotidyltransferase